MEAYTPTQTGVGEKADLLSKDISLETFIQDITDFLTESDLQNVVLVGHSFAGISISGVADRMPERISRHGLGNGLPATYIAVTQHYLATTASRNYAKTRSDWQYVETQAGHDAMVTSPQALCELIAPLAIAP